MKKELKPVSVAIIGCNGYTGAELLRLLLSHPQAQVRVITSRQHAGQKLSQVFPNCWLEHDLIFQALDVDAISKIAEVIFLCLPHHESMEVAAGFLGLGKTVVDLSADFRLRDVDTYEEWYGEHTQKEILKQSVYGLPELYRDKIKGKKLVASPGCYPTSILLGLAPLLKSQSISLDGIICDSKSGVSGAGRGLKVETLSAEVSDNFKAYGVIGHRHIPEIEQELSCLAGQKVLVRFTPHLLPISRGILSTIYVKPKNGLSLESIHQQYVDFYRKERFVKVLPLGQYPQIKSVTGTNECHLGLALDERTRTLVIISTLDNLTKGASGQAVQAFNIVMGYPEDAGLDLLSVYP